MLPKIHVPTFSREVYSPSEAAVELKACTETVLREIRRRRLEAYKVGRSWRITRAALENYCAANTSVVSASRSTFGELVKRPASVGGQPGRGTPGAELAVLNRQ